MPDTYHDHEVVKIDDLKFFECPLSAIRPASWHLLRLVNDTLTTEGEYLNIGHLPELMAIVAAQESRYRVAVRIVKEERASDWFRVRRDHYFKAQSSTGA